MATDQAFKKLIDEALSQSISGWDFAWVSGRLKLAETSWNYRDLVIDKISRAESLVDLCTGGGEFLASLGKLPGLTFATEGYEPNVSVARQRLEPLGVEVLRSASDDELPLPTDKFDLVLNRHGAFSPGEVKRIAQAGGCFLTQQVGGENACGVNEALGAPAPTYDTWCLADAVRQLASLGFEITRAEEERPKMSFADIGAVVFYLKAIPWQIANFNVSKFHSELQGIHQGIESSGSFDVQAHRFLIEATIP